MNTLYIRCQTKDYILDIVAARAGMRINKVNSEKTLIWYVGNRFDVPTNRFTILNLPKTKKFGCVGGET